MADFILQATLSNLIVSAMLAAIAWYIQKRHQAAPLANLLWIMVLLKMVTPPLFDIPLLEVEAIAGADSSAAIVPAASELENLSPADVTLENLTAAESAPSFWLLNHLPLLGYTWIVASAALLALSLYRIIKFHVCLRRQLSPPPAQLTRMLCQTADAIGLGRLPRMAITQANISPFVWWSGGRPLIVIPRLAIDGLSREELRLILAHELAHVKRHDFYVRWLEWLSGLALWWNPVLWVARRQLRTTEEIACDAMVIQSLRPTRQKYARSLLNMAELLTASTLRPPAVASAINSGGMLEQRLTMIITQTNRKLSGRACLAVFMLAIGILPLGLVYAQDYEAIQKRLGQAVKAGEISRGQAGAMLDALKGERGRDARQDSDQDMEARKNRYIEGVKKIEEMVKEGKVSKEDAEKRLGQMRARMFPSKDGAKDSKRAKGRSNADQEMEYSKREYMAAAEKIERMFKEGKVSKEDAEKRLDQMRKKMFPERGTTKAKIGYPLRDKNTEEASKREYMAAAEKIEAMVKEGKVSKEDAEKRLGQMRARMFPSKGKAQDKPQDRGKAKNKAKVDADMDARKQRYMEGVRYMEGAVKAGRLSKEDAEKRLIELRKAMFPEAGKKSKLDPKKPKTDADMEAKKRGYMERVRRIEAAVEAGQVSKENAEKRLIELRKALFPETGDQAGEKANEKANSESDEKANGQRRRRLLRRNGG